MSDDTRYPNTPLLTQEAKDARFWQRVVKSDGCWSWDGDHTRQGYGRYAFRRPDGQRMSTYAHRRSYELTYGPVPDGMVLDHFACDNPGCCNPAHVRPVTVRENNLRGRSFASLNAAKTHCKNGHEFTPENTATRASGVRYCRTCHRANWRRWRGQEGAPRV